MYTVTLDGCATEFPQSFQNTEFWILVPFSNNKYPALSSQFYNNPRVELMLPQIKCRIEDYIFQKMGQILFQENDFISLDN